MADSSTYGGCGSSPPLASSASSAQASSPGRGGGVGWFIGWDLLLEYTAIVAVVGIGISGYFGLLVQQLGLNLPEWMLGAPCSDPEQPTS